MRLSRVLSNAGYSDVLTLTRESNPPSVRALAADLGRDKGAVSRDLQVLAAHDVVEYEEVGRAKIRD